MDKIELIEAGERNTCSDGEGDSSGEIFVGLKNFCINFDQIKSHNIQLN